MSGIILRWLGGGGGDTIMNLLSHSNNVYTNIVATKNIDPITGRSLIKVKFDEEYPNLHDMALVPLTKNINNVALKQDIVNLVNKKDSFILKMHYWDKDFDNEIGDVVEIVDIGCTFAFIPFIVTANLNKTPTLDNSKIEEKTHCDKGLFKIAEKLTDEHNKMIVTWNIITDMIKKTRLFGLENAPITTEDLFYDKNHLKTYFQNKSFTFDSESDYLDQWLKNNKKFLPSQTFQDYIKNTKYDYMDDSLEMVERYTLLALSGKNFQFLG